MKVKSLWRLSLLLFFFWGGCSDDEHYSDVDGLAPTVELATANIKTEPGREFVISATIVDRDGIKSIHLVNQDIYLDKTIDLTKDSLVTEYDLSYKFTTKSSLEGDSFPITVEVTDLGGRVTTTSVLVTMDGDFVNPTFLVSPDSEMTVLLKTETRLNVKFTVQDDKALDVVSVEIPEINYSREVSEFTNSGKTLDFNEPISLPSTLASYNLTITATDKAGLETTKTSLITVSEMPDFPKMYLIDVADASKLNSDIFGIPMLIQHTGEFSYQARYYSEAAGTEIRFAPQKTDFSPICFGKDPANTDVLTDDPNVSLPIVLPAKGYYQINFNVKTGVYSVATYTPTDTPIAIGSDMYLDGSRPGEGSIPLQIGLVGSGIPGAGSWNTAQPLILTQSSENPYLFSVEMTLTAGAQLGFIIQTQHSWGWWPEPYWRWDRANDPESNVANGGENPGTWTASKAGRYLFKFDSHLKRSKFYPID